MEKLITLLLHLVQKVPYLSEVEKEAELDLLRDVEAHLGVAGIVPPPAGASNAPPAPAPEVPVPGPVAEPAPADSPEAQAPPPVSPDVVAAPEAANVFSATVADLSPQQREQMRAALDAAG